MRTFSIEDRGAKRSGLSFLRGFGGGAPIAIAAAALFGVAAACGGADTTLNGDGGDDGGNTNDVTNGNDVITSNDAPADVPVVSCDGGLTSCNGKCVDTSSDAQNCGGCGVVCNTTCTAGICSLIGSNCGDAGIQPANDQACLTIDATNVYWGTGYNQTGSVWKVPVGGGCPALMVGSQDGPHGMASDGTNLYFANLGGNQVLGSVMKIPINGNVATPIATLQPTPLDVAVDANNVYWTNNGDGSVWKSDKNTPNPIKLAGPNGAGHAQHLRVDATNVYFTDRTGGLVYRVPIVGGSAVAITTQTNNTAYIAIDKTNAYFGANPSKAGILSVPLAASAGTTPTPLVSNLPFINGIETDGTSLWYAMMSNVNPYVASTGEIHRATVGGKNDVVLASKQNGPNCIAVDSTSVYWINDLGGLISKTGK